MSKKKEKPAAAEGETGEKAPKSKKTIILGLVGGIVLFVAGGKVMGGETKTVVKIITTTTTIPMGQVVALDAITLNLADGHLLKVGIGFQLEYHEASGGEGGHGAPAAADGDPTKGYAKALDICIDELSKHTMDELTGEGRAAAKEALVKRLEKTFHGEIEDVYFHQFVMQ